MHVRAVAGDHVALISVQRIASANDEARGSKLGEGARRRTGFLILPDNLPQSGLVAQVQILRRP